MPASPEAKEALELAESHLERVLTAWDDPTDWSDLSIYGLYCLEAAIKAAHLHISKTKLEKTHYGKAEVAGLLHNNQGLPDIEQLLIDLNQTRKAIAYGDVPQPVGLVAEATAVAIENYVEEVKKLLD